MDLLIASDDGIELPLACVLGEIAPELVEGRGLGRLGLAAALPAARGAAAAGEAFHDLLAHALAVDAELEEHARRHPLALANEAEQQMLGADVVVAEEPRLLDGELEDAFGARRERDLAHGERAARGLHHVLYRLLYLLGVHLEARKHLGRDPLAEAQDAEQEMLGADVLVLQPVRLVASEIDDLSHPFGEFVIHVMS